MSPLPGGMPRPFTPTGPDARPPHLPILTTTQIIPPPIVGGRQNAQQIAQRDMEARRESERSLYLKLARQDKRYGGRNHGAPMLDTVASWRPSLVVDLGCGRNNFARALRERSMRAVGVDFALPEADVSAPMHKIPLPDGCADVITSFDALEHLLPEDVDTVIDEIARLATAKARLCMTICPRPSFAKVDGRGLHPTVKPIKWWIEKFSRIADLEQQGRFLIGTLKI